MIKENEIKERMSPFFCLSFLFPVFFSFQFEAAQGKSFYESVGDVWCDQSHVKI